MQGMTPSEGMVNHSLPVTLAECSLRNHLHRNYRESVILCKKKKNHLMDFESSRVQRLAASCFPVGSSKPWKQDSPERQQKGAGWLLMTLAFQARKLQGT